MFSESATGGSAGSRDAVYFSFITITTVGYGDIHVNLASAEPLGSVAQSVITFEILTGLYFLATILTTLVQRVSSTGDGTRIALISQSRFELRTGCKRRSRSELFAEADQRSWGIVYICRRAVKCPVELAM
jgi:Ion channel